MKYSTARAIKDDLAACGEVVQRSNHLVPRSEIEEDGEWSHPSSDEVIEMLRTTMAEVNAELTRVNAVQPAMAT